ncbi:CocE/NonD family hydrolase [Streptomyces spororaveus]|uniref:Peptidase S15 n=1 Tax=Streptomyces spororaveus TaxID=284039 RepID=A0ABQ3T767_9ACTN|nr:CocE/NonD family hydrolase [Streptomyces spororaveus]GHI76007.1 putative peptidase S15 [Streptomyces spororaveus]
MTTPFANAPGERRAERLPLTEPPPHARQHAVSMRDGIRLATDTYLPPAGDGPVLLARLPYDKTSAECFMPQIADWFTAHGYVVVVQDVRGKLRSDGALMPFVAEIDDAYDTLEWIVAQPWATGPVGMFGDSYYGFTQWAAAASGHPALCAITPRVTAPMLRRAVRRQDVFPLELCTVWALQTWVDEGLYDYEGTIDWRVRPQSEIAATALGGRRPLFLDEWATGKLDVTTLPVTDRIPTLHLAGFDDYFLSDQLAAWEQARTGPAEHLLVVDVRDHGWTVRRPTGEPYADPFASPGAQKKFLDDYLGLLLPFFERHLKGAELPVPAAVRWRLGSEEFREDDHWPPRGTTEASLFLTSDGRLSPAPSPTSEVRWHHDPTDPVPSLAHPHYPNIDPPDESCVLGRDDVVSFVGEPAEAPMEILGRATLAGRFRGGCGSAHVMVRLLDLAPDGTARRIGDGAALIRAPWPAEATVDLGVIGCRLDVGHRLAVLVSGSSFPQYAVHPGTDEEPWTATTVTTVELAMATGGTAGTALTIGILNPAGAAT